MTIMFNYIDGQLIDISRTKGKKRGYLIAGIVVNIAVLGCWKYSNFIVHNLGKFISGLDKDWTDVILPLGISFFTFQGISYIIDIYRGDAVALSNPMDAALYISFFPQLVAGPIVRFKSIASLLQDRPVSKARIGYGFRRFVYGLSKKLLLADTFGMIADGVFSDPVSWNMGSTWIGIIAYTLQIYYDFSGYSEMAIGLGAVFGFHFDENFHYPYISLSITDFWHRWHISLSSWFRDYVYIPLGGNRVGTGRHLINIMVVWILTGIWHGAEWTFLLWGIYYGILLIIEKYLINRELNWWKPLRWLITIVLVMIGWVIFRSENISDALLYLKAMFSFTHKHEGYIIFMRKVVNYAAFWTAGVIGIFPISKSIKSNVIKQGKENSLTYAVVINLYTAILLILSILFLIANNYKAFIYFQF